MKKFSFSLQRLLDYTKQILDVERATLGDMNAVMRGFQEELEATRADRVNRVAAYSERLAQGTTPLDMEMHRNFLRNLDDRIFNKEVQIDMQRKVVEKQTDRVRDVNIEISTMEKLREKKMEEYKYLETKEQELFIEEFVTSSKAIANQK